MSSEKSIFGKAAFFLKLDLIAALRPYNFDIVLTLWLKLIFDDILVFDDVHRSHAVVVVFRLCHLGSDKLSSRSGHLKLFFSLIAVWFFFIADYSFLPLFLRCR